MLAVALVWGTPCPADLVKLKLGEPFIFFSGGEVHYDADADTLCVEATPIVCFPDPSSPPQAVVEPRGLWINVLIDDSGHLAGGVPDDDLLLTGGLTIDTDGDGVPEDLDGTLLSGEVERAGHHNDPDTFNFSFLPTGGELKALFASRIGVHVASECSSFEGTFTEDFAGGAKGNLGTVVPEPVTCLFVAGGLVALWRRRRR